MATASFISPSLFLPRNCRLGKPGWQPMKSQSKRSTGGRGAARACTSAIPIVICSNSPRPASGRSIDPFHLLHDVQSKEGELCAAEATHKLLVARYRPDTDIDLVYAFN